MNKNISVKSAVDKCENWPVTEFRRLKKASNVSGMFWSVFRTRRLTLSFRIKHFSKVAPTEPGKERLVEKLSRSYV